ncbi:hypothetical protein [Streptomyces sp. NPDC102264]|uniref:hypothetical protein n=1 Tax=Streptomyces sp. NPDC102264 TaxID=3366149 RepID=UPI00382DDC7A
MALYKVIRTEGCQYDEYDAIVVRSTSEKAALKIATSGDEKRYGSHVEWDAQFSGFNRDGSNLTAEMILSAGPAGLILGSFNAG